MRLVAVRDTVARLPGRESRGLAGKPKDFLSTCGPLFHPGRNDHPPQITPNTFGAKLEMLRCCERSNRRRSDCPLPHPRGCVGNHECLFQESQLKQVKHGMNEGGTKRACDLIVRQWIALLDTLKLQ